ncbi:MAG: TauD/TfdA dioxygenase family protein [bacterium]
MEKEIYQRAVAHKPQFKVGDYEHFNVEPLSGALGAEIHGLDIATNLSDPSVASELRQALSNHLVLIFRDQHLGMEKFRLFGQLFGQLQMNPAVIKQGDAGDVMLVRQEADEHYNFSGNWHSDVSWAPRPAGETALYAIEIPPCGGDTHFANTILAFETLPDEMKKRLIGLRSIHQLERSQREFAVKKTADADASAEQSSVLLAEHPVVRRHPVTGASTLFVSEQFTLRFAGMTEEESTPLLQQLFQHQTRPDFTCRIRWKKGTLAIWDNRATIHYASNDYPYFRREMMRVSTVGEVPLATKSD